MLTHVDLFSGIGGFALAAGWAGFRTVAFCEIEPFCQEVLRARFGAVAYPDNGGQPPDLRETVSGREDEAVANSEPSGGDRGRRGLHRPTLIPDIFAFDGSRFRGATLLTGGFPCQPFSVAGKRRGKEDDRHLWPEMLRVIREARPTWVVGENVSGLIRMELDQVLADLEMEGYTARTFHIGAVGVNAPHRRMRAWIVAHARTIGQEGSEVKTTRREQSDSDAPDAEGKGLEGRDAEGAGCSDGRDTEYLDRYIGGDKSESWDTPWIEVATRLCRVDDGLSAWVHSHRVARLKALGNSIVPAVAHEILKGIVEIEKIKEED